MTTKQQLWMILEQEQTDLMEVQTVAKGNREAAPVERTDYSMESSACEPDQEKARRLEHTANMKAMPATSPRPLWLDWIQQLLLISSTFLPACSLLPCLWPGGRVGASMQTTVNANCPSFNLPGDGSQNLVDLDCADWAESESSWNSVSCLFSQPLS